MFGVRPLIGAALLFMVAGAAAYQVVKVTAVDDRLPSFARDVSPKSQESKPIEWVPSDWRDACLVRHHRRLYHYDPGITGHSLGYSEDCRACNGVGGHYIPESKRRKGDSDLDRCDDCGGTGVRGLH